MQDPSRTFVRPSNLSEALNDFRQARAQASLQEITSMLRGKPVDLLSYDDVADRLQVIGQTSGGQRPIPVASIVGSVGRYTDFTRTFLPRRDSDAQRWAHVRVARDATELPPIDVYQIGDAYFVLDGNHRVSIARQQGATHIDAIITLIRTRVPLSPDDNPDTLIVKTEHASFLTHTRLDVLRPEADVRVSAAGQYAHLENLIEVHRYFVEEREQRTLDDDEAVTRWYDEAYLPAVEAIREQGILRYFPGRTETDLYVFIATHQAELRKQAGWTIAPEVATANLAQNARTPRRMWFARAMSWLRGLFGGRKLSMAPQGSWSQGHVAARYSGQLFADILLPLRTPDGDHEALAQALLLAKCERARLYGLYVTEPDPRQGLPAASDAGGAAFREACSAAGVEGQVAWDTGPWLEAICRRATLVDAVIVGPGAIAMDGTLAFLLQNNPRPLLLVTGASRPTQRVLLYYDGSAKAREALFAATYMAEQWQTQLVVLIAEGADEQRAMVQAYLEMHELAAPVEPLQGGWDALAGAVERHESDLLVLGYSENGRRAELALVALNDLLKVCDRPILVCA